MIKKLFFIIIALTLAGCSLIGEYGRSIYENSRTIGAGYVIENPLGLYSVTVPEDYLFEEHNKYHVELQGKGGFFKKYSVFAQPIKELPKDIVDDLDKSLEWIKTQSHHSARKDIVILDKGQSIFKGKNALYFDFFFPVKWHKGFGGMTVIDRPQYGYRNVLFYSNGHLFWLYYGSKISTFKQENLDDIKPEIAEGIKTNFSKFIEGFELL